MTEEFYVGYLPGKGPALAAFTRRMALVLLALVAGTAMLLVSTMSGFSNAAFEFGVEREFEGVLMEGAVPVLSVERPGTSSQSSGSSSYLLVAFGKHGVREEVTALRGKRVRMLGSLIYRDDQTMIEVVDGSIEDLGEPLPEQPKFTEEDLGIHSLTGEIVDSKCYLGVMKPGNLKPHRACAVRCISGGVPPVLLVRNEEGRATYYLLVSEEGKAVNSEVLDRVAEPLLIEGRVVRRGGLLFLYADPRKYQPAP